MSPTRPPVAVLVASLLHPAWLTRLLVAASYLLAGSLNARAVVFGGVPEAGGVLASGCYLAAWLANAAQAGREGECRALRRMAAFWAVTIGGTAICGTLLRLHLGVGASVAGGWVVPAILLVVAAPLYGLAGWFSTDPLAVLVAVAMGTAALTIVVSLAARATRATPARAAARATPARVAAHRRDPVGVSPE